MDFRVLKQWIYPDKCIVCQKIFNYSTSSLTLYTCPSCEEQLLGERVCQVCGSPFCLGKSVHKEIPKEITGVRSLFPYIDLYKQSVLRWKYKGIRKYAKGFGRLITSEILEKTSLKIEGLIPIPIASNRYDKRGFNQALDLAKEIGSLTGIPVYDIFRRSHCRKPQSACTKSERRKNIKGTIRLKSDFSGVLPNSVAFIDDIYTTGSTLNECIEVFEKTNGYLPKEIYILTVCRAL